MSGNKLLLIGLMFCIFWSCKCKSRGMMMFWTLGAMVSISFRVWKARLRRRYPPVQQTFGYLSSFLDIFDLLPHHVRDSTTHPWQWCIGRKACGTHMWSWYPLFAHNLILMSRNQWCSVDWRHWMSQMKLHLLTSAQYCLRCQISPFSLPSVTTSTVEKLNSTCSHGIKAGRVEKL